MRRILILCCALLAVAGAGCTKPNDPNRPASPPPASDNNDRGGY